MNPLSAKDQRLAREAAATEAAKAPPLEPKFPHRTRAFDPAIFKVDVDPPIVVLPVDRAAKPS